MASRMLGRSSLGGRADAATSARAAAVVSVSLTQVYHRAAPPFTTAVNNGDPAPATGSEEDRERAAAGHGPAVSRAAEKAADDVGGKVKGAAEEVKEAGREVKDRAKEVGEDVKERVKRAGLRE